MLRLHRAIVAIPLLLALILTGVCNPSAADEKVLPAAAPPAAAHDAAPPAPAENEQPVLVSIETDRFQLRFPLVFTARLHPLMLVSAIEGGFARVEDLLGPFETKIDMFVAGRIVSASEDFPEGLTIAGVTFKDEDTGKIHVVVALGAALSETWPHELFHARMRELGLDPPLWFEEGAAHYVEAADGFNEQLFELLKEEGPLTKEEIAEIDGVTSKEMRMRASGWAVVYYLTELKGHKFSDVVRMDPEDFPDPKEAFEAIKKHLEEQSGTEGEQPEEPASGTNRD